MNVAFLLKEYFPTSTDVSIDVFDQDSLNDTYQQVLSTLTAHFEIEVSVLQALSYCFYEILDNVHIHSGRRLGTAMTHFAPNSNTLRVLVADDGIGIRESLSENNKYQYITEDEALRICLQDSVTDGKGMGFGLYATSRLMKNVGINFVLHSGHHKLISQGGHTEVIEDGLWQGTIVYMEISTSKDIDPNEVVDHRTNADEQFNEAFVETEDLETLWTNKPGRAFFRFADFGNDFGTREMGARLREKIAELLNKNEIVTLDFSGVGVVSNSFADECIAKMLLSHPLQELKKCITFSGLNSMAERSVLVALQRRYRMMKESKNVSEI